MASFEVLLLSTLKGAVPAGTPLILAAVGAIFSERSGVYNIALEGLMLIGALTGIIATLATGNAYIGVLSAGFSGMLMSVLLAFFTITLRANQIVCGFALVILGTGISSFVGISYVGRQIHSLSRINLPLFEYLPFIGEIFFQQDLIVYISYLIVIVSCIVLFKTRWGIAVRASGEDPHAAQLMGVNVTLTRYCCVLFSGFMAGIAGAYLSVVHTEMWVGQMTAGRGWIAVALVIFSSWHPLKALFGAYLFGAMISLQLRMQAVGVDVSVHLMSMLPYAMTIAVLLIASRRKNIRGMPASLGKPYCPQQ